MSFDAEQLFNLLPAIHRARDLEAAGRNGTATGPLQQLLALLAEQIGAIQENIDQLYDDLFIETCAGWVVPYIGDIVGYQPIRDGGASIVSRAEVANTIRWRRAKGTVVALEGVGSDVTGRDVVAVEYFRRLATTQNLNHLRTGIGTASLADATAFADPAGPFDIVPRGAELRGLAAGGRWNIMNVGCFLWPWQPAPRTAATPYAVDTLRFRCNPLGVDMPLLNMPAPVAGQPNTAMAVATMLRRRGDSSPGSAIARSVSITVAGAPVAFAIGCLADASPTSWAHMPASGVILDPELGRIAFAAAPAGAVQVSYWYASLGLLGGGAYPRSAAFAAGTPLEVGAAAAYATLAQALAALPATGGAIIEVAGNGWAAAATLPAAITVAAGATLEIRAADESWPVLDLPATLVLSGGPSATLVLDGFIIQGAGLSVPAEVNGAANGLTRLTLRNCTLVPGFNAVTPGTGPSLASTSADTVIELIGCISGPILTDPGSQLRLTNCIIDAAATTAPALGGASVAGPAGAVWLFNCTLRGSVAVSLLALASNCIFLGGIMASQRQNGILRFCCTPAGTTGPRQYSCVAADPDGMAPQFLSFQPGSVDYARLAQSNPAAILNGADDGGQIGAYHDALDTPLADGLSVRLAEYTPFSLQSGVFMARSA